MTLHDRRCCNPGHEGDMWRMLLLTDKVICLRSLLCDKSGQALAL